MILNALNLVSYLCKCVYLFGGGFGGGGGCTLGSVEEKKKKQLGSVRENVSFTLTYP